ncbi:hypothetical protein GUJ93_ZPchr0002g24017 [Zizania palustris]|uniref:Uncharacterized protein n=1 Tax=Zizania palustris TaxID=103762 RepID=A0A8J5VWV3_ZIZPA|nr:hypothetical protein GUJ93_ZPchr0002g24017 [Zizania palustris]
MDTSDDMESDLWLDICLVGWCRVIVDGQVEKENVWANPIVVGVEFLVVVEAEPETTTLLHLYLGQSFYRQVHHDWCSRRGRWWDVGSGNWAGGVGRRPQA